MGSENNSIPYVQTFSENNCFLCGKNILKQYSVEHIFPKWLQDELKLWNKQLVLLNGSSIQYRYLTVPCCQTCNSLYLSKIENTIHNGVSKGFTKFKYIEEPIIFQWIGKIFYSLLYKELTLLLDRSRPSLGTINTEKFLEIFNGLHSLLQSARYPTKFEFHYPWSLFLFNIKPFGDERDFDFSDDSDRGAVKIRIRDIGIIACLLDHGLVKNKFERLFYSINNRVIHPIQFEELASLVFYQNILLNRTPKFVNILSNTYEPQLTVVPLPIGGFSLKPIFREWSITDFSFILANYLKRYGFSHDDLLKDGYEIASFTFYPDGSYKPLFIE